MNTRGFDPTFPGPREAPLTRPFLLRTRRFTGALGHASMPKNDWAKYAARDKARQAIRSGDAIKISTKPKRHKKRRRKHQHQPKGTCRCCRGTRHLGRDDICLSCYKRLKHDVHLIALERSGPPVCRSPEHSQHQATKSDSYQRHQSNDAQGKGTKSRSEYSQI